LYEFCSFGTDFAAIAKFVGTRSSTQVRTHAQKYYAKLVTKYLLHRFLYQVHVRSNKIIELVCMEGELDLKKAHTEYNLCRHVGYFCCRSETTNALEKQDQQQSKDEKK